MAEPLAHGSEPAAGYRVISLLSMGRDLEVYDAWSTARDCRCVLKRCRPDRADDRQISRLVQEGELLSTLGHAHLVRAYEVVKDPEVVVVLETVTGFTLEGIFERRVELRRRLGLLDVATLLSQLCSVVGYLHRNDFLHLDLKPSNVIVEAGRAKLIDLSLAHAPGNGPAAWGTRSHLAPEQALGGAFGEATDVWALGLIAYEALTGENPFHEDGESLMDDGERRPYRQLQERAAPVAKLRRVPRPIAAMVDGALERDSGNRPTLEVMRTVFDDAAGVPRPSPS